MTTNDSSSASRPVAGDAPLRRDDVVLEELDGEAVLYDPRCGAMHRFNAATLLVWDMCDGCSSREDIAHRLTQVSDVSHDKAIESVRRVISELHVLELLERSTSEPPEASPGGWWTELPQEQPRGSRRARATTARLSRRALLGCGAAKFVFIAPVISTFFASGAYASGPSASAAFGAGGCKSIGYSCTVNTDCCENTVNTACQDQGAPTKTCCVQMGGSGCEVDSDCCNMGETCVGGVCV